MEKLSNDQIAAAGLDDWRMLGQALHARFGVPDFVVAAAFLTAVAAEAEASDHHPDVRLTYGVVDVALCTHAAPMAVTDLDVGLARHISALARENGLDARPGEVAQLEMGLDTDDWTRIAPFWSAVLTGSPDHVLENSVFDPTGRVANVWFQGSEPHEEPRQRWHPDLWLPPEVVEERIAVAVRAGGTVVDTSHAPAFTVLADPDGNKICLCTALERS